MVSITAKGALQVKIKQFSYRLNPLVLIKVPDLKVGDTVRICEDEEQAKLFNKQVGWKSKIEEVRKLNLLLSLSLSLSLCFSLFVSLSLSLSVSLLFCGVIVGLYLNTEKY